LTGDYGRNSDRVFVLHALAIALDVDNASSRPFTPTLVMAPSGVNDFCSGADVKNRSLAADPLWECAYRRDIPGPLLQILAEFFCFNENFARKSIDLLLADQ
jgi:hypothetical protein